MSKIKVNSIEAATGSTVTLPSGQTLDLSSGTVTLPNSSVNLTTKVTGTLPVANGGTGITALGTASQVLRVNSGATALEFGTVSSGVVKKIHTFEFNTRTSGNQTANTDQFTFTSSFTPLDAVNNTLYVESIIPIDNDTDTNDASGYGLRFTGNSTSTNYDNFGKGVQYAESTTTMTMSNQSQFFTIPANTMTNQTYTVKLRVESASSAASIYCPNSTDHARIATQTTAYLVITEFAN